MITRSVKNIYEEPDDVLRFEFTDDYSVFDYGKMPDPIPGKGLILAELAEWFFTELPTPNHFIRREGNSIFVRKYDPPVLETIFRWGAPTGSSWLTRHPDYPPDVLWEDQFTLPVIEFSTKREPQDRILSLDEANDMIGSHNTAEMYRLAHSTAVLLRTLLSSSGMVLWDGKFEFAVDDGEVILVDSIGPDELRVTLDGEILSKQYLRNCYLDLGWSWPNDTKPPPLHPDQITEAAKRYSVFRDRIIG